MSNIAISAIKQLPAIDQLKILKALCIAIQAANNFSFEQNGFEIQQDDGEYHVSINSTSVGKEPVVRNAFNNLFASLSRELGFRAGRLAAEIGCIQFMNFNNIEHLEKSCDLVINSLITVKKHQVSVKNPIPSKKENNRNELPMIHPANSLNENQAIHIKQEVISTSQAEEDYKKISKNHRNHLAIPSMQMGKTLDKEKEFLAHPKLEIKGKGSFGKFVIPEIKINRKNGKITSITCPVRKENGIIIMKTEYNENGERTSQKETELKYGVKLISDNDGNHPNSVKIAEESENFKINNKAKSGHTSINNSDEFCDAIGMTLAKGSELGIFLKNNKKTLNNNQGELAKLFLSVIDAIEKSVHKNGKVHADLKMDNIFVLRDKNGNYQVTIIDYGLTGEKGKPHERSGAELFKAPEISHPKSKYHENQDFYSFTASFSHECLELGIKNNLFGKDEEKFKEGYKLSKKNQINYICSFAKFNTKSSTPISGLVCEEPSQLPKDHMEKVKDQLSEIINTNQSTQQQAPKSSASLGFELMLGALSVASIVGVGIAAIAVAAAAPFILGAGILAVSVSIVGAMGVAAHGLFNAYRHENRDKGPSSSPSLTL